MLFKQAAEVEDGGFVGDALKAQPRKLAKDGGFVQCLLNCRIAVAGPVLH